MTGNEYQRLAMRTDDGLATERLEGFVFDDQVNIGGILNGCLGLSGETGELLDMVKKMVFHNKPFDEEHAKKELGDVLWYVAEIAHSFGWELDEIMLLNINKLKARYPEGFDTERANHRSAEDL